MTWVVQNQCRQLGDTRWSRGKKYTCKLAAKGYIADRKKYLHEAGLNCCKFRIQGKI